MQELQDVYYKKIKEEFTTCFNEKFMKLMFEETNYFTNKDYHNYLRACNQKAQLYTGLSKTAIRELDLFIGGLMKLAKSKGSETFFKKSSTISKNILVFLAENSKWDNLSELKIKCIETLKIHSAQAKQDYCLKYNISTDEVIMGRDVDSEFETFLGKWEIDNLKMSTVFHLVQGEYSGQWLNY